MSRTKRKHPSEHKTDYYKEAGDLDKYRNPEHRDEKPWNKPVGWFKRMYRRIRRHKEKMAMRNEKEIPKFKKDDQWNWT